ncbi:MAG: hypothetical protein ACRDNW_11095 [Trebonia sp.]
MPAKPTGAGSVDPEWASFVAAPPPVRRVAEDWLAGLARNPAAPPELLVRLLDTDAFLHVLYRPDVPAKVVDAAYWHPSEGVRWHVWETQPLAPGQWNKAVRDMPDWRWRQFMIMHTRSSADRQRQPGYREPEPRLELRPTPVPDEIAAAETAVLPAPELIRLLTTVTEARHLPHNVTVAAARSPAIPAAVMDYMAAAAITALADRRGDA